MKNSVIRLDSITINNFKNVQTGELSFVNSRKNYRASIVGLYGQNGSGKTALIDALSMFKYILCGAPVPLKYADYINVDSSYAHIKYVLKITDPDDDDTEYKVEYELSFRKEEDESYQNTDGGGIADHHKIVLFDEVLSCACKINGKKGIKQVLIDTRNEDTFGPKTKYDILTGKNKSVFTDLIVAKKLAAATSRSFIFSSELVNVIRDNCRDEAYSSVIDSLVKYGNYELFVIDSATVGRISLNAMPLIIGSRKHGSVVVSLNDGAVVPDDLMDSVRGVIGNMNIVLPQLNPGMSIDVKEMGTQMLRDGSLGTRIQLVSNKASREIPLQYESDGIKKIIAILQLLIAVYNKHSITVAIDELDAGVFEYLLGEILRIISEKGRGQLIFTSHNLRPLETLDKGFVAFTTTNPAHRYIRFRNVKTNNNLRDFYYRDIILGEQNEPVYEPTHNSEIALAFREAGELYGS